MNRMREKRKHNSKTRNEGERAVRRPHSGDACEAETEQPTQTITTSHAHALWLFLNFIPGDYCCVLLATPADIEESAEVRCACVKEKFFRFPSVASVLGNE